MADRNFDSEFPIDATTPGPTFTLGGIQFHTKSFIHPSFFLDRKEGVAGLIEFISNLLDSAERETFVQMTHNPDTLISADQLGELSSWLIAEVSGRPTNAPDSSGTTGAATS